VQVLGQMLAGERARVPAIEYRLTGYDAAYLELALRKQIPMASLDGPLNKAAVVAGVVLLTPLNPITAIATFSSPSPQPFTALFPSLPHLSQLLSPQENLYLLCDPKHKSWHRAPMARNLAAPSPRKVKRIHR
jgi:hypothetical protein